MPVTLRSLLLPVLVSIACGPPLRRGDSGSSSSSDTTCGDGVRQSEEPCDGADLGESTCATLGWGPGTLRCAADCSDFDATGCSGYCARDCTGRRCGPDPRCGASCGTCTTGLVCDASGQCVQAAAHAPSILSFTANVSSITEGGSVTFSAVVTDPDGIADLAGGTLKDTDSGSTYGAFSQVSGGSFTHAVTWQAMQAVNSISFTTSMTRSFTAEFFDSTGKRGGSSTAMRLTCPAGTNETARAVGGRCTTECVTGTGRCASACIPMQSDPNNCGSCGRRCTAPDGGTTSCSGGQCSTQCPSGTTPCNGRCVNTQTDANACGGCENECPQAPYGGTRACVGGQCRVGCPSGKTDCDGACTDLQTDGDNCGECGRACTDPSSGSVRCQAGLCAITCDTNYTLCGAQCTNLQYDHFNCGTCGHACGDYASEYYACSSGRCATTSSCRGGYYKCGVVCCNYNTYHGACHWGSGQNLTCGS